ncbi:MAG: zf-HC2 domain-containing protein, partial [Oscillospiraceae bacterium]|nr:zf-HC2 domain-containing protein [Oscillospiraceae bacterium]
MNICEEYAALLDLYVDGELAAEDMARVQTHLDRCPACRAYVDDSLAIRAAFPDAEDTVLPQGFHDSVMAAVAADAARETAKAADAKAIDAKSETSKTADHKAPRAKQRRKGAWASMLPLAAACLAVVVLVEGGVLNSASGKSAAPAAGYAQSVERAAMAPAAAPESEAAADVQSEESREVTYGADAPASAAPSAAPMAPAPAAMDVSDPADAKTSGESADNQPSVFTAAAQAL